MSIRNYLQSGGHGCPFCGPDAEIEGGSIEIERGTCSQRIGCLTCNASWYDCYTLTGIEATDDGRLALSEGEEESRRQSRPDDVT